MLHHACNYDEVTSVLCDRREKSCLNYQIKSVNPDDGHSTVEMAKQNSFHCINDGTKTVDRKQIRTHNNGQMKAVNFPAVVFSSRLYSFVSFSHCSVTTLSIAYTS